MKVLYISILLILLFTSIVSGTELDEVGSFKPIIESVELDLFLNVDGSVDSTITIKSLSPIDISSEDYIIMSGMIISDDEFIDQNHIEIIDLHNPKNKFTPTGNLKSISCLNKYYFNVQNNDIQFCVPSTIENDLYYRIKYKYESIDYPQIDACSAIGVVRRPLTFSFSPQINSHYASYSLSADSSLLFNQTQDCPEGWKKSLISNGYKCINKNLTFPNRGMVYYLNATLRGIKKDYIEEKGEQDKIDEQKVLNFKLKIKNTVDKILLIILGIITFVPSISGRFKTKLANLWKKSVYKIIMILSIIIFIVAYFIFQMW